MDVATPETVPRKSRRRADAAHSERAQPARAAPAHDAIARRAYELYLERGGGHGGDVDDWLRAEQELATASVPFVES